MRDKDFNQKKPSAIMLGARALKASYMQVPASDPKQIIASVIGVGRVVMKEAYARLYKLGYDAPACDGFQETDNENELSITYLLNEDDLEKFKSDLSSIKGAKSPFNEKALKKQAENRKEAQDKAKAEKARRKEIIQKAEASAALIEAARKKKAELKDRLDNWDEHKKEIEAQFEESKADLKRIKKECKAFIKEAKAIIDQETEEKIKAAKEAERKAAEKAKKVEEEAKQSQNMINKIYVEDESENDD